jgi:hypothetical protein
VRELAPEVRSLDGLGTRGVIVTAVADGGGDGLGPGRGGYDFVSRYFAPAAGIDEDRSPGRPTAPSDRSGPSALAAPT